MSEPDMIWGDPTQMPVTINDNKRQLSDGKSLHTSSEDSDTIQRQAKVRIAKQQV